MTKRENIARTTPLRIPQSAVLELTYACNHACLFCSCPWEADAPTAPQYQREAELNLNQWMQAIDVLEKQGVKQLSISGGEALLKEGLTDLLAYIRQKNHFNCNEEIVLISNGLAMNEHFLEAFRHYRVHLSLSLPGLTTFEKHTGVDNAAGVLHWLRRAKEAGVSTTVNITVTRINYHELFETIANGLIAGADTLLLNRFLVGGRGITHQNDLALTQEQLVNMLNIAEEVLTKANRSGSVGTEYPLCLLPERKKYKKLHIGSICSAGKNFLVISPDGYVRVCNHSPRKVGHIFSPDLIFDIAYWNMYAMRAYTPSSCILCKDVSYCDCGCRETAAIVYGSPHAKDPCLYNEEHRTTNMEQEV